MILAVLQARMSSSRLPGKVLKPLCARPMAPRQIERLTCAGIRAFLAGRPDLAQFGGHRRL